MPSRHYYGIRAKLERVSETLGILREQQRRFLSGEDYHIILDYQSKPGYLLVKVAVLNEPPSSFSVLVGELLYQLRSSLDHLVCALTEASQNPVTDKTEFPIFDNPAKFRNPRSGELTKAICDRIGGLASDKQTIIEQEQPFNRYEGHPHDDPLWFLYEMANFDKHRALHVMNAFTDESKVTIYPPIFKRYFILDHSRFGTLEGETEIARYRMLPVNKSVNVEVNANVSLDVAFDQAGPGQGRPVNKLLGDIGIRVAYMLRQLE